MQIRPRLPFADFRVNLGDAITGSFPCQRTRALRHDGIRNATKSLLASDTNALQFESRTMRAQFPEEETKSGEFKRQEDAFRDWVSNDGSTPYAAEAGRYHLYVSLACPWASRTVIVRKLKGLEDAIGMTVVDPVRDDLGWAFRDPSGKIPPGPPFESTDPINGFQFLSEAYTATDPDYHERVTVPVLWDKQTKRIVNNCEDDICRMFNDVFNDFARNKEVDLFPKEIQAEHAKLSD